VAHLIRDFRRWLQANEADSPRWRAGPWGWVWMVVGTVMLVVIVVDRDTPQAYVAGGITLALIVVFSASRLQQDRRARAAVSKFAHLRDLDAVIAFADPVITESTTGTTWQPDRRAWQ
jgi:hypothetical protein